MVINPASTEKLTTPEQGVCFFEALEHLDDFTMRLIEDYPHIVTESEAVKGMAESQPFFHEEYKEDSDMKVVDRYITDLKYITDLPAHGRASVEEKNERLRQEMSWRHRLREESAKACDAGDAIKKSIFGGQIIRTFDSDKTKDISNGFMESLIEMCDDELYEIGLNKYGKLTLPSKNGNTKTFFAKFGGEDEQITIFGRVVIDKPNAQNHITEANVEDFFQLVAYLP